MDRELFLKGISSRLGRKQETVAPHRTVTGVSSTYAERPFGEPDIPRSDWPARIAQELTKLGATPLIANSTTEAAELLMSIVRDVVGGSIVSWGRSAFSGWDIDFLWDTCGAIQYVSGGAVSQNARLTEAIRSATIGVTTVDFAVVNSGTLALYTNAERNRSVSLLPTMHLALVRESQLVGRLGDALPDCNGNLAQPVSILYPFHHRAKPLCGH